MAETENGDSSVEGNQSDSELTNNIESPVNGVASPKKRGRPKGPPKAEEDSGDLGAPPRKRGRPKGTPRKIIKDTGDGTSMDTPKRGRPKKVIQAGDKQGSASSGKKKGRPKGSHNKPLIVSAKNSTGRLRKVPEKFTIALPRKNPGKRGRPKNIGRGRPKKPRDDSEASSSGTIRKGRGRPRKSGSKVAKVKKASSSGSPRKRGRPPKTGPKVIRVKTFNSDGTPRKRGRPKKSEAIPNSAPEEDDDNNAVENE